MSPSNESFMAVIGNDFGKSSKEWGLKSKHQHHMEYRQDSSIEIVDSARIFHARVRDPNQFHCLLHVPNLTCGLSADFMVVSAVAVPRDRA